MKQPKIDWEFWGLLGAILFPFILMSLFMISIAPAGAEEVSGDIPNQQITHEHDDIKELVVELYLAMIICDPKDISRVTNLKEKDYVHLVADTWWEGHEDVLIELEQEYGINAIFAMAVSSLESGYGKSSRAKNRHNYYGLATKKRWNSLQSNTRYWGELMNTMYVNNGRLSVTQISSKYCPQDNDKWARDVRVLMRRFYSSLIRNLTTTKQ